VRREFADLRAAMDSVTHSLEMLIIRLDLKHLERRITRLEVLQELAKSSPAA
jgi:hypothetical protein